ncbi:MAG: hypothetical protein N4A46_13175 [Schleiferiaceae bacterium]|jgi:hypothetical protein|nr:hypothetical protein [Schleiferiaceae bacterium]
MKLSSKLALVATLVVVGYYLWNINVGFSFRNDEVCKTLKLFRAMEFEAVVTDTVFTNSQKLIYVTTLKGEESVIDLSKDSAHIYQAIKPTDTLSKEFGSDILRVHNGNDHLAMLTPDLCHEE